MTIQNACWRESNSAIILGGAPGIALDRTGIALLDLIALTGTETMTLANVASAVNISAITSLFALIIVSAQFEQSGFYNWVVLRLTKAANNPQSLLGAIVAATGLQSAVLRNDVLAFALTPLLCTGILETV